MNVEELIDNKDIKKLARKYYRYLDTYNREDLEQEFFLYCFERINDIESKDVINLCKECYSQIRYKQSQEVITVSSDYIDKIKAEEQTDIYITTDNKIQYFEKKYYCENKDRVNKRNLEWHYNNREKHLSMMKKRHKEKREEERIKDREYYIKNREHILQKAKDYYYNKKKKEREQMAKTKKNLTKKEELEKKQAQREKQRAYREEHKDELNAKRRARYAEKKKEQSSKKENVVNGVDITKEAINKDRELSYLELHSEGIPVIKEDEVEDMTIHLLFEEPYQFVRLSQLVSPRIFEKIVIGTAYLKEANQQMQFERPEDVVSFRIDHPEFKYTIKKRKEKE